MINAEEEEKLRTICEFLFFDHLKTEATFPRFEQCFQPLFPDSELSMLDIFTEIAGKKRKYITFPRIITAFQNRAQSKNLSVFFDRLLNTILQKENAFVGKERERCLNYSTLITCRKRQCITLFQVLSDQNGIIHGFNLQYDEVFKCRMFPAKIEDDLIVTLEMTLGLIDKTPFLRRKIGKLLGLKQKNYRDAITHIFGTIDPQSGIITFLGFKCISGKMAYVGKPKGEGFLFGQFGAKLHDLKIQMTPDGITLLQPIFESNVRKNYFLGSVQNIKDLKDDGPIKDETHLATLNDMLKINQMVTTPVIEDNHFFDNQMQDTITGNDYKEVVNQGGRDWLIGKQAPPERSQSQPSLRLGTLDDCLKQFNQEYNNRSIFNLTKGSSADDKKDRKKKKEKWYKRLLHKTKDFITGRNRKKKRAFKKDVNARQNPGYYLFDRNNYLVLKENLGKKIYNECLKGCGEVDKEMKKALLAQIIAPPGTTKRVNIRLNINNSAVQRITGRHNFMRALRAKLKEMRRLYELNKMQEYGQPSDVNAEQPPSEEGQTFNLYSDGLQFVNDIGGYNPAEEDNGFFGYGERRDYNNPFSNYGYGGYSYGFNNYGNNAVNNYGYNNTYYPPIGGERPEEVRREEIPEGMPKDGVPEEVKKEEKPEEVKKEEKPQEEKKEEKPEEKKEEEKKEEEEKKKEEEVPVRDKAAQDKWKEFRQGMINMNGLYLIQTIGCVKKALKAIEEDDNGTNRIPLSERIKLYKLLEANEAIINFLTQDRPEDEKEEEEPVPEEEEADVLVPDEHPEDFTSLEQLEQAINQIKAQLDKKDLSPEDRKKLEKLYNLYLQQKNILIENETKKNKNEIIDQNAINVNKLIEEEQEKRKKAEEEEAKRIEELQKQEEQAKKSEEVSTKSLPSEENIYKNQEIYKGDNAWTDPLFPPEKKSLCPFNSKGWVLPEDVWESDVDGWDKIKWCRASEIFDSENFNVFEEGGGKEKISTSDIQQGQIGDCYFLSAVGALCNIYTKKGEKLIEDLFLHTTKTKEHVYGVYIFINGVWELVLVDDYFPYIGENFKQFSFASSQGNELWISLMEKAWAKVNGCYAKIGCGGAPNEVFDVLTEAYSEQIAISESKATEIWNKMVISQQKGYVMTAGTSGDVSNLDIEEVGLSPGHAYTVLSVHEMDGPSGKEKVVRLRNPWGNGEWNGDWSDSSSKWNYVKGASSLDKKDDGVFFMGFKDFIKYYVTMGIAKIHPDYETAVLKIKKENATDCQLIRVTVPKNGVHTYLSLYQKNPRIITKQGYYQKTALCFLMLCDKDFKYINSMASNDMHICVEETLNQGEYYIFCDVNYRFVCDNHGFNITSYAECQLSLENITKNGNVNVRESFEKALISYFKVKNIQPNRDSRGIETYSQNYGKDLPFMLLVFNNTSSENYHINAEVKPKGSKTFCIYCDTDASENSIKVIKDLPPHTARAVKVLKYTNSSLFSISYAVKAGAGPSGGKQTENVNDDPIFKQEGEAIDEAGNIVQYYKQETFGFTIGLENKGDMKLKFKLSLEGLDFTDLINRGRTVSLPFDLPPKDRKKWTVNFKPKYDGDVTFQFNYA